MICVEYVVGEVGECVGVDEEFCFGICCEFCLSGSGYGIGIDVCGIFVLGDEFLDY